MNRRPGTDPAAPRSELREQLDATERHERRAAARALLMHPFLPADHDAFPAVRRHATWLRDTFARETGWLLQVDRSHARLRKTPARKHDTTRVARPRPTDPPFSRRRYVLLCLALAVLESAERQTALGKLAELIVGAVAADPELAAAGVEFRLETRDERRDLVAVARLLLGLGVLRRVDGDEAAYIGGTGDALYAVDRTALAGVLATRRPPSSVTVTHLDGRLDAITDEPVPDTPDGRNRAIRHRLTRQLLDDAVLRYEELDDAELAYLTSQRARLVGVVHDLTGLVAEIRAEGIAMVDDRGDLTDLRLPEEGTDGHLTLLLAEELARSMRERPQRAVPIAELEERTRTLARGHASFWRKDASDPAAAPGMTRDVVTRLVGLDLAEVTAEGVRPLPPIARYAVGEPVGPVAVGLFGTATGGST